MGNPFTQASISNYNSNPPSDDGAQTAANRLQWSTQKTKLTDPIKTALESDISNTNSAFGKVVGGAGVTTSNTDYTVQAGDQGKLVKMTGGSTLTTADATVVGAPFVHAFSNLSSGSITLDGNGSQTIDGLASITIPTGAGGFLWTDASNWFTAGTQGALAGKQLMYGDIINGTIVESNSSNAVTYALKTLAGNDPSSSDPVLICFRNATLGTGNYVFRSVTAAMSLTISSGSTLGTSNNTACRIWIVLFDDGGTIRMGAINCLSGTSIYPLGQVPRASSTAEGGAGGADSAQTFYTGTAVTNKAYVILGYATYESGLVTAGSWNVSPDRIQLYGPGVPLPGNVIQNPNNSTTTNGSTTSGSFAALTNGPTQAISLTSAANIVRVFTSGTFGANSSATPCSFQLARGSTLIGNPYSYTLASATGQLYPVQFMAYDAPGTTSSTTYGVQGKSSGGGTINYPQNSTGAVFEVTELMA